MVEVVHSALGIPSLLGGQTSPPSLHFKSTFCHALASRTARLSLLLLDFCNNSIRQQWL